MSSSTSPKSLLRLLRMKKAAEGIRTLDLLHGKQTL
jgi:hypothetical protein